MGEDEMETQVLEVAANGISSPEKSGEVVSEKNEEIKEMDKGDNSNEKAETKKMDADSKVEEGNESKKEKQEAEEKEEPITEAMEEETEPKEDDAVKEKEETKGHVQEKVDRSKEEEEKMEESKEVKGSKKRGRGRSVVGEKKNGGDKVEKKKKKAVEEKKETEPRTPAPDRPQRERKSVERLVASIEKDAVKEFHIEKGRGTPLKDIPNVAFKLSRRKIDDTFKLLHSILFGRRGKAFQIKSNISRFSGFVWHDNEEKQKIKVKEKFDKCNKEKLLEFCDLLDIPIAKATTKKEDIVARLIEFLVIPHATTTVLLAEKEKESKNKRRKRTSGGTSSGRSAKSWRTLQEGSKTDKKSTDDTEDESEEEKEEEEHKEVENENGVAEKSDAAMPEHSESEEKSESEEESEEDTGKRKRSSKSSSIKESAGKSKIRKTTVSNKSSPPVKKTPKKSLSKHVQADNDSDASPNVSSRKKKNEKVVKKKSATPTKSVSTETTGKRATRHKVKAIVKEEKLRPTDDELRDATCEILKEVDFNTATFTDILKLLAKRFDVDLTQRKSSIKVMIQEELTKLADEADDEDGEGGAEKDETQSAGPEVEA